MWVTLLLAAWAAALIACTRLCRVSIAAADPASRQGGPARKLTLYETAYLSGGPQRVTDLALVTMCRQRRLLLAHTGWATLVEDGGRDEIELSVVAAIGGPGGQSQIPPLRTALAGADAVHALADRLASAGLAVPENVRTAVTRATRQVRGAALLVLATAITAEVLALSAQDSGMGTVAPWFALPLVLTAGCLVITRIDSRPYAGWASPAGRLQLRDTAERSGGDRTLAALALRGPSALPEPELRAALGTERSLLRTH